FYAMPRTRSRMAPSPRKKQVRGTDAGDATAADSAPADEETDQQQAEEPEPNVDPGARGGRRGVRERDRQGRRGVFARRRGLRRRVGCCHIGRSWPPGTAVAA